MYSDKKNILQLVSLLKAHNVTDVVVCPGSRNAPIVHTLTNCEAFHCYTMTDERSAGFFAIGLALNKGKAVAVCCTSGSALLNLHPAVAEAFYQNIPLVVISADRPAAWIGQMDGQTLPQPRVFGTLVKKSVDLPEIHSAEDEWYCNRLINEALLETSHHGNGPVHINIPLSEPLFEFNTPDIPEVRVIKRGMSFEALTRRYEKTLIIIGQTSTLCSRSATYLPASYFKRFAIFAEHLYSGNELKGDDAPITNFDAILYAMTPEERQAMAPDLVITLGGHIVSKRLKQYIRKFPPREHIHISPSGDVADVFCSLTTVLEEDEMEVLQYLYERVYLTDSDYRMQWKKLSDTIVEPSFAYSEMAAIGQFIKSMPEHSSLHLANSSTVRYAQLFKLKSSVTVCCNRGVNGIEGSLSTAIGYASAEPDKLNFAIIGDLSFFYDMNALWNGNYGPNIRIMLLNNGSGEIFHSLPGLEMTDNSRRAITATHATSAKGWSQERGFLYIKVESEEDLQKAIEVFCQDMALDKPVLMEVFTDAATDVKLLKDYYHQLKNK